MIYYLSTTSSPKPLYHPRPIYEYMENETLQKQEKTKKQKTDAFKSRSKTQESSSTLPLLITLIGIFCYLGVILPSVFEPSTRFLSYSTFDILLMVGGAALIGLGAYFWFKARAKVYREEKEKAIDLA